MLTHPATAWCFLLGSLLLTAAAWYISDRSVRLRLHERFVLRTDEVGLAIRDRIASYEAVLRGGAGLFATGTEVTRQRWQAYVGRLDLDQAFPGIQGLGYSVFVVPADLPHHVRMVRAEGFPGYAIRPAGERPVYSSIIFLEPFDWRNQRAFGYDMFSEPVRRRAMEQARDSGLPAATAMVTLVQETDHAPQRGFLVYVPVYRPDGDVSTGSGRRDAIQGFVYAPFRIGDLMRGILGKAIGVKPDLHFHVYDGGSVDEAAKMYDSADGPDAHDDLLPEMERRVHVTLPGGQTWTVHFQAHQSFSEGTAASQPLLVAVGGLIIDLLLFFVIADLARRQQQSRMMAQRLAIEVDTQRQALHAGEARLANALAGVGDGVWDWHVPSGTVAFSDGWKSMLGYAPDAMGNGLDEWSKRVHPDDLARTMADVEAHLAGRTACYRNEHRVQHQDGSWIWVLDRGLVIERDAAGQAIRVVGTHTDITERKRLEGLRNDAFAQLEVMVHERTRHLERANHDLAERDRDLRIFASVIEQSPLGILLVGSTRLITYANGAAVHLLGHDAGSLVGSGLLAGVPESVVRQAQVALDGPGHWSGLTEIGEGTPSSRWLDIQIVPIAGTDGQRLGFACLLRDTTQLKHLEIEHQHRMAELMQAAKLAALGTLTAGIGHEIGNPANFISINAPLLKGYWGEVMPILERHAAEHQDFTVGRQSWVRIREVVPELFAGIESGVGRIRRLIGELRQFAVPDLGDPRSMDANAVVGAAVLLTRHAIDRATTRCTVELDPALPAIRGSFQRLEQAMVNLILNACQALPGSDRGIAITTRHAAGTVHIAIADDGVGIDEADLPRLGEPFHTTRRDRGGTGLGLSIVRRIVEDHGGTIRFASRPGHGTTVTIALPATGPDGPPA